VPLGPCCSTCSFALRAAARIWGIAHALIPLFAICAFLSFTLSQTGIVMLWKRQLSAGDQPGERLRMLLAINAAGAVSTGAALAVSRRLPKARGSPCWYCPA